MIRKLQDFDCQGKRVLLRVDLNVPVINGKILDSTRIDKVIPTIKYLLERDAIIILSSHFGRPKGVFEASLSLEFLTKDLEEKLGTKILFCSDINKAKLKSDSLKPKEILLLENLRFYSGETKNDLEFATCLASLADLYVNDAFSCSHRSHASIVKIAQLLPSAAGLLLSNEIDSLSLYLNNPSKPMMAIIGGSKVSTKLALLSKLVKKVDYLVIGGAMANTFLKAQGYEIGSSFYEPDLLDEALEILNQKDCNIILPQDAIVANEIAENVSTKIVDITDIAQNYMILDLGPKTIAQVEEVLNKCKAVILNGPVGAFEYSPFSKGTFAIAATVARLTKAKKIVSVAGGGDIVAAISQAELFEEFSYISTAGGAFLEWLEGKSLPGLEVLESSNTTSCI